MIYEYKVCQSCIIRTDRIKDLGVFLDSRFYFYDHVNYVYVFLMS
jgi:hypothetical protein